MLTNFHQDNYQMYLEYYHSEVANDMAEMEKNKYEVSVG